MDEYQRNEMRLAALAQVDPEDRLKYRLGRMLQVDGETRETASYSLDFRDSSAEGMPSLRSNGKSKARDQELRAVLNGDGLRLLDLPGLRELPITSLGLHRAFGPVEQENRPAIRAFLMRPEVERLRELDFDYIRVGDADTALAKSAHLGGLTRLGLRRTRVKLKNLLEAKSLGGLRYLDVSGLDLKTADFARIVKSKTFAKLTGLGFALNDLSGTDFKKIVDSPELARFEDLSLGNSKRFDWSPLVASKQLWGLRRLNLWARDPKLTDETAATVLSNPRFEHLTHLWISIVGERMKAISLPALRWLSIQIQRAEVLRELARQPVLRQLDHLSLDVAGFQFERPRAVEAIPELYDSPHFRALRSLDLSLDTSAPLPGGDVPIWRLPPFERLTRFRLQHVSIDAKMLAEMLASRPFRHLESLELQGSIGAEGARLLAESPDLAGLKELHLPLCDLEDAAVFARSPHMKNLQVLDLGTTDISPESLKMFLESKNFANLVKLRMSIPPAKELGPALSERLSKHKNMPKLWVFVGGKFVSDDVELRQDGDWL